DGVRALLGPGRKDESGDFTKGARLNPNQTKRIMVFVTLQSGVTLLSDVTDRTPSEAAEDEVVHAFKSSEGDISYHAESNTATIQQLRAHFGNNRTSQQGIDELNHIHTLCKAAGYECDRIRIDPSVVRGLEYYTGPVYEVELTFPIGGHD